MTCHNLFDDIADAREALHAARLRLLDFPLTPGEYTARDAEAGGVVYLDGPDLKELIVRPAT
jgi:hypothetical protein